LLADLIDELSNWYVRRGRKRYWKAEDDQDKASAHWTLYEALTTCVKLLAPFVPFITEAIYQGLRLPGEPESVHLCDFPAAAAGTADPALETEMAACRRVVSLARAARNRAKIRTRQPLPELVVSGTTLGPATEALLMDELNVKQVRYDEQAGSYVSFVVRLNFEAVGPKLGRLTPQVAKAVAALDPAAVAARVAAGGPVTVTVVEPSGAATEIELAASDLLVRSQERDGFAVERDAGVQVALSTAVSEQLLWEGLAREVVNRIQRARKEAGFAVADRIEAILGAEGALRQALEVHAAQVAREVLADRLTVLEPAGVPAAGTDDQWYQASLDVDGDALVVRLRRTGS
jgi:isoleucyl-tRNA synthetase